MALLNLVSKHFKEFTIALSVLTVLSALINRY